MTVRRPARAWAGVPEAARSQPLSTARRRGHAAVRMYLELRERRLRVNGRASAASAQTAHVAEVPIVSRGRKHSWMDIVQRRDRSQALTLAVTARSTATGWRPGRPAAGAVPANPPPRATPWPDPVPTTARARQGGIDQLGHRSGRAALDQAADDEQQPAPAPRVQRQRRAQGRDHQSAAPAEEPATEHAGDDGDQRRGSGEGAGHVGRASQAVRAAVAAPRRAVGARGLRSAGTCRQRPSRSDCSADRSGR